MSDISKSIPASMPGFVDGPDQAAIVPADEPLSPPNKKRLTVALAELHETVRAAIQAKPDEPPWPPWPPWIEIVEAECNRYRDDIFSEVRTWFQDGHLTAVLKTGRGEWEELPSGRYWLAPTSKQSIVTGVATSRECPWDGGIIYVSEVEFDALAIAYITGHGLNLDALPDRFRFRVLALASDLDSAVTETPSVAAVAQPFDLSQATSDGATGTDKRNGVKRTRKAHFGHLEKFVQKPENSEIPDDGVERLFRGFYEKLGREPLPHRRYVIAQISEIRARPASQQPASIGKRADNNAQQHRRAFNNT